MKLEVNITKTKLFVLIVSIFAIFGMFFAYAYNTGFDKQATGSDSGSTFGHSADELIVKMNDGNYKTVQELLKNGVNADGGALSFSSDFSCASNDEGVKTCLIGTVSSWDACFLTSHFPITSSGSWDAGCGVEKVGTNWVLKVKAGGSDGLTCIARCAKSISKAPESVVCTTFSTVPGAGVSVSLLSGGENVCADVDGCTLRFYMSSTSGPTAMGTGFLIQDSAGHWSSSQGYSGTTGDGSQAWLFWSENVYQLDDDNPLKTSGKDSFYLWQCSSTCTVTVCD